jgi:hypothetical protein
MLPNTFIAGAQKSGTTTLRSLLMTHADVFFPARPKEIHYFDLDDNFQRGLPWLEEKLQAWAGEKVVGQSSPLYLYDPRVPDRIQEAIESPRFIVILRHPAARAYGHYWHEVKWGREGLSFERALLEEESRIRKSWEYRRVYSYVDRGRYAEQLERYVEAFGRENLLVLLTEELATKPGRVRERCARFLGIDPEGYEISEADHRRLNAARIPRSYKVQRLTGVLRSRARWFVKVIDRLNLKDERYPPMSEAAKAELERVFRPEVERLDRLGLVDVSHWSDQF